MPEKRKLPGPPTAPFKNGSLLDYVDRDAIKRQATATDHYALPDEWRPNDPVYRTLDLGGIERGRSAARFVWRDEHGHTFPMFMTDVVDLMGSRTGVYDGVIEGHFVIVKRGANYGLLRLRDPLLPHGMREVHPLDRAQRGSGAEAWIKARRDEFGGTDSYAARDAWQVLDDLLDDYRLHADTGTALDQPVPGPYEES